MPRADKVAEVAQLAEEFRTSSAVVLTEYRGLSMADLSSLRRALGRDVTYAVVKNTLARRAAADAGADALVDSLRGPSALAFVKGDPVEAAKGLREFGRAHPALVLRGGLLSGEYLDGAGVARLADLESREVLLARAAGLMKASLTQAVSLFAAPLASTARAVDGLRAKLAEGAGEPEAPAAEAPAAEAPAAEAPAEPTGDAAAAE